jgi:FixJ family two-component response regulator
MGRRPAMIHGVLEAIEEVAIPDAANKVVAIVEDDASMLKALKRLLLAHGFATEAHTSAEAFLDGIGASRAGCLVLDINLGGISGIDLQRRLAAAGSKLPIILMTAVDSEAIRREGTEAGCVAYLRKPFPARRLIDAIYDAVG